MARSPTQSREYRGNCHCAAVGFVYRTALDPEQWPIRACQCTFCRMHAGLSTSDPDGSLEFFEHAPGALHRYQFGRKTADFMLCRNCGAYLGAVMHSGSAAHGVINVRVLGSLVDRLQEPKPMDYDGEDLTVRLARRAERWTPVSGVSL